MKQLEKIDHAPLIKQLVAMGEQVRDNNQVSAYVNKPLITDISRSIYTLKYIHSDLLKCEMAGTSRVVAFEMLRYCSELQRKLFTLLHDEGVQNG